jgi:hypothetical protein
MRNNVDFFVERWDSTWNNCTSRRICGPLLACRKPSTPSCHLEFASPATKKSKPEKFGARICNQVGREISSRVPLRYCCRISTTTPGLEENCHGYAPTGREPTGRNLALGHEDVQGTKERSGWDTDPPSLYSNYKHGRRGERNEANRKDQTRCRKCLVGTSI